MEYKDYYKILGVDKKAAPDKIKREYRKLARKYHPDVSKHTDSDNKFKEVGEAYEVLGDPKKRKAYDELGNNWQAGEQFNQQQHAYQDFGGGFSEGTYGHSDFFESLFGHAFSGAQKTHHTSSRSFSQNGEDVHAKIRVPLEDAFHGSTRNITFTLPTITLEGKVENKAVNLKVEIPKGIKSEQKIRLAGQGGPGINGGKPGDMYLEVEFEKHKYYKIDGADLYIDLPVAPWEAALGAKIKIPTPSGSVEMKIPANTLQDKTLRLKGKGIPAKKHGDLYVVIDIVLPPAKDDKSKKVYEEMKNLKFNPRTDFMK